MEEEREVKGSGRLGVGKGKGEVRRVRDKLTDGNQGVMERKLGELARTNHRRRLHGVDLCMTETHQNDDSNECV